MSDLVERLRAFTEKRYDWLATNREATAIAMMDEAADEIARLRKVLETIAGAATDKLQALQAKAALENIGPRT